MTRPAKIAPLDIENAAADWIVRRDAGLTAVEELEFARWQAADPRHAAALAAHDQTWAALERPRQSGDGKVFLRQLGARASRRRRRMGSAMAVLSLLVVTGLVWRLSQPTSQVEIATALAAPNAFVVLPETRALSDGSVVELNAGAEIAVDFSGPLRRVALHRGEAHFQVAKNPERPFVVEARGIAVRAVGTSFSVGVADKSVEILVTEGRVAVDKPAMVTPVGPAPATEIQTLATAEAGHRVVVDIAPQSLTLAAVSAVSATELEASQTWRAPRLEFSETPLPDAVALLNQHSAGRHRVRFVVAEPALRNVHVSGFFRADNTETFVRLLEASFGVQAEREGDTIILRKVR